MFLGPLSVRSAQPVALAAAAGAFAVPVAGALVAGVGVETGGVAGTRVSWWSWGPSPAFDFNSLALSAI